MNILTALVLLLFPQPVSTEERGHADEKAAEIAEQVMLAMGGAEAYDATRYLTWRFFGRRYHVWDKHTGDIRVEDGKGLVVVMNLNTRKGHAWMEGAEITDPALLEEKLTFGYEAWVNDSYWLVMPYKLRDPGVTLAYTRADKTEDGRAADVLTMTFQDVGVTPENKYEIFVDAETHLVTQWSFFKTAEDAEPAFTNPWKDWKPYGKILLSADRGRGSHTDVAAPASVPEGTFTRLEVAAN